MGYVYGLDRKAARVLSYAFGLPRHQFDCFFDSDLRETRDLSSFYAIGQRGKSDGTVRTLHKPIGHLKVIQRSLGKKFAPIVDQLLTPVATGFRQNGCIKTNALMHLGSHAAVCIDLRDAFASARENLNKPLRNMLREHFGIESRYVVCFLEELIYYSQGLPQGAPTSPVLFNLACQRTDIELARLAAARNAVVSRYADNYVFSTPDHAIGQRTINAVVRIIEEEHGWSINWDKFMVLGDCNRPTHPLRTPGVHIVDHQLRLPSRTLESLRTKLYRSLRDDNHGRARAILGYARWIEGEVPPRLAKIARDFSYQFGPAYEDGP